MYLIWNHITPQLSSIINAFPGKVIYIYIYGQSAFDSNLLCTLWTCISSPHLFKYFLCPLFIHLPSPIIWCYSSIEPLFDCCNSIARTSEFPAGMTFFTPSPDNGNIWQFLQITISFQWCSIFHDLNASFMIPFAALYAKPLPAMSWTIDDSTGTCQIYTLYL